MPQTAQLKQAAHFVLTAWQQVAWFRHKRLLHRQSKCKTTPRHWAVQREGMLAFRHQSRFTFYGGTLRAVGHPRGLTGGLCLAGPWFRSRQHRDARIQGKAFVLLCTLLCIGCCHVWCLCPTQKWPGSKVSGAALQVLFGLQRTPSFNPPTTDTFMHWNTESRCVCVYMYVFWVQLSLILLGCDLHRSAWWKNNCGAPLSVCVCLWVCVCVQSTFLTTWHISASSHLRILWSNNAINLVQDKVCIAFIPNGRKKPIRTASDYPLYCLWKCVGVQKHAKNSFFIQSSMYRYIFTYTTVLRFT